MSSVFDNVSDPTFQNSLGPVDSGSLIFDSTTGLEDVPFFGSLFDTELQSVDPTNSGDTGANQNISSPPLAGKNNPETAGGSTLGTVLNSAINAGFSAWQLASLPQNTPKTVTTQVGATKVTATSPSLLAGLVGPTTTQGSQLLVIGILVIVGILIYKSVKK